MATRLAERDRVEAIVALGHEGANGGTVTEPTGPLIDIADGLEDVDAVIGDHNDIQVLAIRPNGVLVTENRGRGIRFTRVRLHRRRRHGRGRLQDGRLPQAVEHRRHPDPAIQARIDELNADARADLRRRIGDSTVGPSRAADSCGNADGRPCESLIGNVVTDAMRTTYATDFAITNSGGLRADLTCPTTDTAEGLLPAVHAAAVPDHAGAGVRRCCRSATSWSRCASTARS